MFHVRVTGFDFAVICPGESSVIPGTWLSSGFDFAIICPGESDSNLQKTNIIKIIGPLQLDWQFAITKQTPGRLQW